MLKNEKGFTFIELLIVVAILAIMSAIMVPQLRDYKERKDREEGINNDNLYVKAGTAEGTIFYIDTNGEKRPLKVIVVMDISEKLSSGDIYIIDGDKVIDNGLLKYIKISTE